MHVQSLVAHPPAVAWAATFRSQRLAALPRTTGLEIIPTQSLGRRSWGLPEVTVRAGQQGRTLAPPSTGRERRLRDGGDRLRATQRGGARLGGLKVRGKHKRLMDRASSCPLPLLTVASLD